MKRTYKIIRALLIVVLALAVIIPAAVYVSLSLPGVQNSIRETAEEQLSDLLGADVAIERLTIRPFNRATINNAVVTFDNDTILKADRISGGANLYEIVMHRRFVFNYAEVVGLDARVWRDSASAPLNIQPIIDRLRKPDNNEAKEFVARVNTVVIRNLSASYDVLSEEETPGRFNPSHIKISNLKADVNLPRLTNDSYDVDVRRFSFDEQSGLRVTDFVCHALISPEKISWDSISVSLPASRISLNSGAIPLEGKSLPEAVKGAQLTVKINDGYLYLPDLKAFVPVLGEMDNTVDINLNSTVSLNSVDVSRLAVVDREGWFAINLKNVKVDNPTSTESLKFSVSDMQITAGGDLMTRLNRAGFAKIKDPEKYSAMNLKLKGEGDLQKGTLSGDGRLNNGEIKLKANYARVRGDEIKFNTTVNTTDFDLATLLDNRKFGELNSSITASGIYDKTLKSIDLNVAVDDFEFLEHNYDNIVAKLNYDKQLFDGTIILNDEDLNVDCQFNGSATHNEEALRTTIKVRDLSPNGLNFTDKYPGYEFNGDIVADLRGNNLQNLMGRVVAKNFRFEHQTDSCLVINRLVVDRQPELITLTSDKINGYLKGNIEFASIGNDLKEIVLKALPAVDNGQRKLAVQSNNKFDFDLTITDTEQLASFFRLPVSIIYPMTISGQVDSDREYADIEIDARYIRQGSNKLIENSRVYFMADGNNRTDSLYLTTAVPSKDGLTTVLLTTGAANDRLATDLNWKIDRAKLYQGHLSLNTDLSNVGAKFPAADVDILKSQIVFNDSVWTVEPAHVAFDGENILTVDNLNAHRRNQFVKINGVASPEPEDSLKIDVLNFNLDYHFETLAIDAVMLGGDATGEIYASSLFSPEPRLETEGISVKDITYNKCYFGDALVKSHWDNENKAVCLDGLISQPNGKNASIVGEIFPMSSMLDLRFTADETPVAFMHKYMGAFASDISGTASGWAHLYGTFHDIDLVGQLYANDLRLKLDATNTYFYATDSVKITPGVIHLDDITIRDKFGHTGKLNGVVNHTFFRDPTFNFTISDVRNMLVYEETSKENPDWYGRVFVNGGATVDGRPGIVKIDVEATTTEGSIFTFVLSELEVADDYTFLTFRDSRKEAMQEQVVVEDKDMVLVNRVKANRNKNEEGGASDYIIEFRVGVTPQTEIDLVMDPISGDKIKSYGTGNVRMVYTSKDNDLQMFGNYTLEKGTYNFTLQDIIIKDFTINQGSTISFTGDPMKARLDINAYYQLNANLSDLDESFLQDKDLNRTNVPVRAILMVKGDIQQPEIAFDLAFPTLTSDAYRKVKSIVSTDEMMNRQVIYLLALNRFYTPDYMGSTTKGNELFSVASSTLTSQLTNMIGHLSDNWSVSPNLRSDRGDFSDVEVDVALSSRLLNNRLLLNGNFGYRDKSLNNNQFIGDFEIQYLLNRAGTIRLKAYSYSNDENYYVRTAATTQGIGVMFKRDFDDIFGFLKKPTLNLRKINTETSVTVDELQIVNDSTAVNSEATIVDVEPVGFEDTGESDPASK